MRRADGTTSGLGVRGLPLGVLPDATYRAGAVSLDPGDSLVIYSDGLVDARPDLALNVPRLATAPEGAASADEMVDRLVGLTELSGPPPDDLTVVVLHGRAAP